MIVLVLLFSILTNYKIKVRYFSPFHLYRRVQFIMVAHFHEVQTVYHNHTQLRLCAVKPCQSLKVVPYYKV